MVMKGLRNLCTPSYVYLVISAIALVVMMYQNMGNVDKYCLGSYSCNVSSTALIFVIKAIYILFWTWVLNLICKAGAPGIAWFVLLLPFILLFVILGGMMFYENTKEGFACNMSNYCSVACENRTTTGECSCPYTGPNSEGCHPTRDFAPYPCNWDATTGKCSSPPSPSPKNNPFQLS